MARSTQDGEIALDDQERHGPDARLPAGRLPARIPIAPPMLSIDGQDAGRSSAAAIATARGPARSTATATTWRVGRAAARHGLRKRHGLQGPIDDAFMDSLPLRAAHRQVRARRRWSSWVQGELAHAIEHWRRQFRGEARVKDDTAVTDADIASRNLVLWGDPPATRCSSGSPTSCRSAGTATAIDGRQAAASTAAHHAPILIYPNPLNPKRYVVLNSGFTFREYDYLNNARQVPKLPDWAIVDLRTPPNSRWPGKIAAADFFDESWQLR